MKRIFAFIVAALLTFNVAQASVSQPPQMSWGVAPIPGYPLQGVLPLTGNIVQFNVTHGFYPVYWLNVGGKMADAVNVQIDGVESVNDMGVYVMHIPVTAVGSGDYIAGETVYSNYGSYNLCCNQMIGGYGRAVPTGIVVKWDKVKRILVLKNVVGGVWWQGDTNGWWLPKTYPAPIIGSTSGASYSKYDWMTSGLSDAMKNGEVPTCDSVVYQTSQNAMTWMTGFLTTGKTYQVVASGFEPAGSVIGPVIRGDVIVDGVSLKSLLISHGYNLTAAQTAGCNL